MLEILIVNIIPICKSLDGIIGNLLTDYPKPVHS